MSFAKYVALVKNLRGVVLGDVDDEGVWGSIQWLVKRFRYRDLGLTPTMVYRYRDKLRRYLNGNPFVELTPPVESVNKFVRILLGSAPAAPEVLELLVYASTYISPAMVIGGGHVNDVLKVAADAVYVCKSMDLRLWKLHLRIADYTILDLYRQCVDEVLEVLSSTSTRRVEALERIAEGRRSRIAEDKKRYWRIACPEGTRFLVYIDMVDVILKHGLADLLEPDHAACLAIVPVVVIPSGLGRS